jgi:serine/threonine-protein kinase HipA
MHLKNWSVLYPDRRTPVLSPAYDMVSTIPYIPEPELALSLGETKSMLEVDEDRFRRFANHAGLPDRIVVAAARDATERLRDAWRTHPATDLLPRFIRDAVSAHLDRAPLGR